MTRWRQVRGGRWSPLAAMLLLSPMALLLIAGFFYPLVNLLGRSLWTPEFSLVHYERLLGEPLYLLILMRTLWIAGVVSVFTLLLGYPVALVMARLGGWKAALVAACVLVPLWTSALVRSYAWVVLLQRNGIVNDTLRGLGLTEQPLRLIHTEGALLVAMTHVLLPFMVLPIYSVLRAISTDLPRAAANLGAGTWSIFRHVTLPLSLPGVFAGTLMVFILSLGFYITPALVGGPRTLMIATLIGQQMTELLNWSFASAIAAALLAVTLLLVAAFRRVLRIDQMAGHAG
ncbi:MAG: ABC transporter permease [Alphaproteobacteria bacterium]|nr:ABC transporter permease [Alphaproteobacteria bacterium]